MAERKMELPSKNVPVQVKFVVKDYITNSPSHENFPLIGEGSGYGSP